MIRRLKLFTADGFDPYRNLALEQHLLETTEEDCCALYLWQNERTVVIGRNQNAWKECRTSLLEEDGGRLARRLSGGGAVFHDRGNLNFTFLLSTAEYDLGRQLEVVRRACLALGIPAEISGRNDLLAYGRKFSGCAFYHHAGRSYHHGTLLVDADMDALSRYLRPSEAKLRAKGVDSVRARVANLRDFRGDLTVDMLKRALADELGKVYSLPVEAAETGAADEARLAELTRRYRSWEWNYGRKLPFDFSCEARFDWGEVRIELAVEYGMVRRAAVSTDAMDWTLAPRLEDALTNCRFERSALAASAEGSGLACAADVAALLSEQDI